VIFAIIQKIVDGVETKLVCLVPVQELRVLKIGNLNLNLNIFKNSLSSWIFRDPKKCPSIVRSGHIGNLSPKAKTLINPDYANEKVVRSFRD